MSETRDSRRPKVLYVDDQPGNLTVFRASMRRYADVRTAISGAEALEILRAEEFPIVISDQRMDGMTGSELLTEVCRMYPDSVRILLTAHADFEAVIAAVNEGRIARFIRKPWDRSEMRVVLEDSTRLYWKTRENHALTNQFVQQARLAAVGQMTAGFAHELANHVSRLQVIDHIMARWPIFEGSREAEILRSGIDGVTALAISVRALARGRDPLALNLQTVELNELLTSWLVPLRLLPAVRQLKTLSYTPPDTPIQASIDPIKLELVLINLVKNAAESTAPGEGVVTISIEADGELATIHVSDNGSGIPDALKERIWDPLCSTKGSQGVGLGLVMSRKLVEAHGGRLLCWSTSGAGSTFSIRFPLLAVGAAPLAEAV